MQNYIRRTTIPVQQVLILRSNNLLIGTIRIGTPTLLVLLEFGSPVPGTLHKGFALQTACLSIREAPRHAKYYVAVKHSCYISKTDRLVLVDGRTYASYHDAHKPRTSEHPPPRARLPPRQPLTRLCGRSRGLAIWGEGVSSYIYTDACNRFLCVSMEYYGILTKCAP